MKRKGLLIILIFSIMLVLQSCSCEHDLKLSKCITEPSITSEGYGIFKCNKCYREVEDVIPMLDDINYKVSETDSTCYREGKTTYTSENYGNYNVTIEKKSHLSYGGFCDNCEEVINNLSFNCDEFVRISSNGGYPRLYILSDGTWLCGYDTGSIYVTRSYDEGKTWSSPVLASVYHNDGYACANVAFYQFDNGDILCAYRAIGGEKREIQCTISKDGGLTWEYHSTIEDNFQTAVELGRTVEEAKQAIKKETRIGFFEPHFGIINGELTVMYADDFSTMLLNHRGSTTLNYETQYIISRTWNENTKKWENRKVVLDGTVKKTVSGITDFSRDGMPVFDQLSDGTYVLVVEGTYRRTQQNGNNPFIILLSYSKDGVTWSNPVEVYVPTGNGTKASAPYICVTSDDRIVISFQTDENSVKYGKGYGDSVSIMKTIISDGTPIDKITKDSFAEAVNVFDLQPGDLSAWNGMYMHEDTLYCVSGVRGTTQTFGKSISGVYMASSKIPEVVNVGTYYDKEVELSYSLDVTVGNVVELNSGWLKTVDATMTRLNNLPLENGSYSLEVIPKAISFPQLNNGANSCGMIFKRSSNKEYYTLLLNHEGALILGKVANGVTKTLSTSDDLCDVFSRLGCYTLRVEFNEGLIDCYVNDELIISYVDDDPLTGTQVGFLSKKGNTLFKNFAVENK